jgi:uridine phosphorylase
MELATLLTLATLRGVRAAGLLLVSDTLWGERPDRLDPDSLHAGEAELGAAAIQALVG